MNNRHIPLQGVKNFRDFGDYLSRYGGRIKKNVMFRSARLSGLTNSDLTKVEKLGIKTVFDLRRNSESKSMPTRWHQDGVSILNIPLLTEQLNPSLVALLDEGVDGGSQDIAKKVMQGIYLDLITQADSLAATREIFTHIIGHESAPFLVHCSAGKDRTGVICALFLWSLGVSWSDIEKDYCLSQSLYSDTIDIYTWKTQAIDHNSLEKWHKKNLIPLTSALPEYIGTAKNYLLAEYKTAENFLKFGLDISDDGIRHLQMKFIE
ncbi:MAG: tyrosine-protein phosphatase [Porticoccaceae bacterium]|nr:tyrosine-protein phosphatase [Porticoccaceae bacterium]